MSEDDSEDRSDTFTIQNYTSGSMSLRSKLEVLHDTLALDFPTPQSTPPEKSAEQLACETASPGRRTFCLKLPSPPKLLRSLRVFFKEHNAFFPCVDQKDFESRLLDWLSHEAYGGKSETINIRSSQLSFAALLCLIFAVSEFIDSEKLADGWYDKATSLVRHTRWGGCLDLDLVCFHTLEAMYLHYAERLAEASRAVALAISLSMRGGLHDQTSYASRDPSQCLARRTLWWTLYYVDRRIAEKSGQPVLHARYRD